MTLVEPGAEGVSTGCRIIPVLGNNAKQHRIICKVLVPLVIAKKIPPRSGATWSIISSLSI